MTDRLNTGGGALPSGSRQGKRIAGALALTVPLGLRVKQSQARENFGPAEPEDGDERHHPAKGVGRFRRGNASGDQRLADARGQSARYRLGGRPCCGETRPRHAVALNATVEQEDEVEAIGARRSRGVGAGHAPLLK